MTVLDDVLSDLAAEGAQLEALLAPLSDEQWRLPTPAEGWDIATSVAHLAWTDEVAVAAASDKQAWDAAVLMAVDDPTGFVDAMAFAVAEATAAELLDRWQHSRPALAAALRAFPTGERMPWFGPPMSPVSMATARLMETWAHGLDVADALDLVIEPTDRLRHVAHIGVRTRAFAFANSGLKAPAEEFLVSLTAPSGEVWTWGPADAAQSVSGPAYDFCVLVTQRRNRADLALEAVGPDADRWLDVAQAFAGPAGGGRAARTVVEE